MNRLALHDEVVDECAATIRAIRAIRAPIEHPALPYRCIRTYP
jgi:hypothetical protein